MIPVVILAISHIRIHLQHLRAIRSMHETAMVNIQSDIKINTK